MGTYLDPGDFSDIDAATAAELIGELEAYLSLHYPFITPDLPAEKLTTLRALLKPVVRRWDEVGTGVNETDITGPFTTRKSGKHVLWQHEKDALRALGGMASGPATSRGSFPSPEPIDDLFVRRPGWPRV